MNEEEKKAAKRPETDEERKTRKDKEKSERAT